MNQFIVLIIFGTIGIINYLIRQSANTTRSSGGGTRPANPQSNQPRQSQMPSGQPGDDERLRKFMQALGVPADTAPPRKIARPQQAVTRAQPPVRRQVPVQRQVVARKVYTPPPPVQSAYQAETVSAPQSSVATGYDVATTSSSTAPASVAPVGLPATSTGTDLKSLLRSSSSVRAAIVLKEILGTPKGLQPMDAIPGLR